MTTSPRRFGLGYFFAASLIVACFARPAQPQHQVVGSITGKVFDADTGAPLPNVIVQAHAITSNRNLTSGTTDERGAFFISGAPASLYTFTLVHDGIDYSVSQRVDARTGMRFLLDNCIRLDKKSRTASVIPGDCAAELIAQAQVVTIGPHRFLAPWQSSGEPISLFPPKEDPGEENAVEPGAESPDAQEPVTREPDIQELDPQSLDPDLADPDVVVEPDAETSTDPSEGATEATGADGVGSESHGLEIEHNQIECLQHDQYPLVDSAVRPGPEVAVCRVYFRSDKYPDFYYVEATEIPETPEDFRAILPKPSPETERVIYYVEAVSDQYEIFQTEEANPPVEDDACRRDPGAYYQGEAPNIVVGATTAGAAAVPPGFQALGITGFISAAGVSTAVTAAAAAGGAAAAAGGVSTALVVVVSGAAVATGGTIVNTVINNGSEAEASNP